MAEELKEKQSEEYQFINEKILSKRKKKWLKRFGTVVFVILMAVLFGVVSQITFLLSEDYLRKWLGVEEKRQEVELTKPTTPARIPFSPTPKPLKTPTPVPTTIPTATPTPQPESPTPDIEPTLSASPGEEPKPTPELTQGVQPDITEEPEMSVTPEPTQIPEPEDSDIRNPEDSMLQYLQIYESIRAVAEEVSDSFVTVEAIEQGVDWFQEVYEHRTRTTGLILGNDGVDLLILVGTDQFSGATSIEVFMGETVLEGSIYSMDKDYGLAVIAVPLNVIPNELQEQIQPGILADTDAIAVGTPVIALGAPNGYEGSMEFGMITSLGSTVSVTDGEVAYFTADITEHESGYGFIVNLKGEILGLITHTHKQNPMDGIFSAISLDSIRGVIVKLLNNAERAYFGIKGQDLPANFAAAYNLESGVYVSEVENASPALGAGIKAGDILVAIGTEPVEGIRTFSDIIMERSVREIVRVKLLRQTEDGVREMTVEVPLSAKK